MKKCQCIKQVQKELSDYNQELSLCFTFDGQEYLNIATRKIDKSKRTKLRPVVAAYCPFCGKKYTKKKE